MDTELAERSSVDPKESEWEPGMPLYGKPYNIDDGEIRYIRSGSVATIRAMFSIKPDHPLSCECEATGFFISPDAMVVRFKREEVAA